jgi:spermidine synthase
MVDQQPSQPIVRPYPLPPLPPDQYYVEPEVTESAALSPLRLIEETDPYDSYEYRLNRLIHSGNTAFQNVVIGETYNYGLALFLDGAIQSSDWDESLYHELLVQPPMLAHPEPRDVLIIGGGEGAALREVLVHGSVRSATMVDIDRELIELCQRHLQSWHLGAFDDPRVRLVYQDGREFVVQDDGSYDVIIVDLVDMFDGGPAQALYTRQFYELLRRRLRDGGIVVVQGFEFSFLDYVQHAALCRTLRTAFTEVHSYQSHIPSFLGSWGFVLASDWFEPTQWSEQEIDSTIEERLGDWLDHLDGNFLMKCFTLCKATRLALTYPGPVLEDGVPFVLPPEVEEIEPERADFPAVRR